MNSSVQEAFLSLVRLGLGRHAGNLPQSFDWSSIKALAEQQGLLGIVLDGLDQIPSELRLLPDAFGVSVGVRWEWKAQ